MWEYVVMAGLLVAVGSWILYPLFRPEPLAALTAPSPQERERTLRKKKDEVYAAIKEMEFDYSMGKISEKDYQELRSQYKAKALEILKELEAMDQTEGSLEAEIEREVRALRRNQGEIR